ncbi:hypothetical protein G7007_20740 [Pseudomonas entomophila]|uniref:type II toxin-antitoxin system RelE/ParE family toxin n=1 Tax=Pseudomonas entomophila TaxID=312306 RepID=UPI0015E31345|nr:type II toxin-antitoxin system RelE/ParE family toxin [Pseudomonas entomophila]MBA1195254.1 hypothetical protein [Pseudomonas entomophila]
MSENQSAASNTPANAPLELAYQSKRAQKEFGDLPERHRDRFTLNLGFILNRMVPLCDTKALTSLGHGVYELIKKGSPGYRVIYTTEVPGKIVVLHATEKTTNGSDRQIANVVEERLKALRQTNAGKGKAKR